MLPSDVTDAATDIQTTAAQRSYLFVLGSSRPDGNSQLLARRAAEKLPADVGQRWLDLRDLPLDPFRDRRHDAGGGAYPYPDGADRVLLEATLAATDLVLVSPLYWYAVSADMKNYLDYWAGWMRVPGVDFKPRMAGRTMWGVSAISEEDPSLADPLVGTLKNTADYLAMEWGGVLLGYANRPGDVLKDEAALAAADKFFAGG